MPINLSTTVMFAVLLSIPSGPQDSSSEFCSSRTTEAYHSPKCNLFVVHDPQRVENLRISHKPAYHTYSRWVLDGKTYVLAYRDIDRQPQEMMVDLYLAEASGYNLAGSVRIAGVVNAVSTERLTGSASPDIVFRVDSGQLQYLDVVRFSDGKAKEVFWYGASEIETETEPQPTIVAKSKLSNLIEEFAWDSKSSKFVKAREYAWHKTP
jgi:hypothetical protein